MKILSYEEYAKPKMEAATKSERIRIENNCLQLAMNRDIDERVVLDRQTFNKIFKE